MGEESQKIQPILGNIKNWCSVSNWGWQQELSLQLRKYLICAVFVTHVCSVLQN